MRSLLITPSPASNDILVDAADWVEINALFKADRTISREDLARALFRSYSIREQRARQVAEDAFSELADRLDACGSSSSLVNRYPFFLNSDQSLLSVRRPFRVNSNFGLLYWFLLFVSRADMSATSRVLNGTDPTIAFERLCADVLSIFWGGRSDFSGSMVIGTAGHRRVQTFQRRIEQLCASICEGAGWREGAQPPGGGDAKLDVVAWRRFADKRQGALIGFAQCKTGLHWRDHLTKLRPETFSRRFMRQPLIVSPVRLYMVPNRVLRQQWEEHISDGGTLLDRCRIVQYGWHISADTLRQCKRWLVAAYRLQKAGRVTT
jgi:hypothetical protein